jgi:hypothetical protein
MDIFIKAEKKYLENDKKNILRKKERGKEIGIF